MHPSFVNRVAIVAGGGSGLGEAIGKALAARGTRVVLSDINLAAAERVAGEIVDAGGVASAIQQDTSKPEDSEKVVEYAVATYGALHYAVNNAGIGGAQAPVGETDLADWNRVIDINLSGVLYGMRYQIPAMLDTGPAQCAIVNMASIHDTVAAIGNGAYTAAKHGVVGLTKNAAAEYGPQGLRINCVGPAYIETPLLLPGGVPHPGTWPRGSPNGAYGTAFLRNRSANSSRNFSSWSEVRGSSMVGKGRVGKRARSQAITLGSMPASLRNAISRSRSGGNPAWSRK